MVEELFHELSHKINTRKQDFRAKSTTKDLDGLQNILLDITLLENQLDTLNRLTLKQKD